MRSTTLFMLLAAIVSLSACKSKGRAPDPVKPVATKVGVTIMVAGETKEAPDSSDPNKTFLSGDFGGINLEVVPAAPSPDAVNGPGGTPLLDKKVETLPDGFLITFGNDKTGLGVESFRTIGGKVIRCSTSGNPLERARGEIVEACKSMK